MSAGTLVTSRLTPTRQCLLALLTAVALSAPAAAADQPAETDAESTAIRQAATEYLEAVEKGDVEQAASFWTADGDLIEIESGHGRILAVAESDEDVRSGVISMAHSWGDLPSRKSDVREVGSTTGRLVDDASDYDPISGIARQSAIPVNVRPAPLAG